MGPPEYRGIVLTTRSRDYRNSEVGVATSTGWTVRISNPGAEKLSFPSSERTDRLCEPRRLLIDE